MTVHCTHNSYTLYDKQFSHFNAPPEVIHQILDMNLVKDVDARPGRPRLVRGCDIMLHVQTDPSFDGSGKDSREFNCDKPK